MPPTTPTTLTTPTTPVRLLAIALALVTGFIAGCVRDDPAFRASDLVAAPSIQGTWKARDGEQTPVSLTFTAVKQKVESGRVKPRAIGADNTPGASEQAATVYSVLAEWPASAADIAAGKPATNTLPLRGYLLSCPGMEGDLLCLQRDDEQETEPLGGFLRFNAHWFGRAVIKGETLTITPPAVLVTLSPMVKLLDPPSAMSPDAAAPTVEAALKPDPQGNINGGSLLTNDPDRALGVYRRYGGKPEFWQSGGLVLIRTSK